MAGIRARRKAERPGQILEAAFDEFVAKGYEAARLEDVAARIGVTKGTIYFYFHSKKRLFEASIQSMAERSAVQLGRHEPIVTGDLVEDIRSFLGDVYRFVVENPRSRESFRLLVAEGGRFPALVDLYFKHFMHPVEASLRDRLAEASQKGQIRGGLDYLAELILSPPLALQTMLLLFPDGLPVDTKKFYASHVEMLLAGIFPPDFTQPDGEVQIGNSGSTERATERVDAWSPWRSFPGLRQGDILEAPVGPGAYEIRLGDELLLIEGSENLARDIATLLPPKASSSHGRFTARLRFLVRHRSDLEYRTVACATLDEALALAEAANIRSYKFQSQPAVGKKPSRQHKE